MGFPDQILGGSGSGRGRGIGQGSRARTQSGGGDARVEIDCTLTCNSFTARADRQTGVVRIGERWDCIVGRKGDTPSDKVQMYWYNVRKRAGPPDLCPEDLAGGYAATWCEFT